MLRSLLVGLDGTADGVAAGEWAIRQALASNAAITALAVVDEPGIRALEPLHPVGGEPGVDPVLYPGYEAQLRYVREDAEKRLADFTARCAEAGVPHETLIRTGSPVEWLLEEAQGHDLIVLGRRTRFRFTASDAPDETAQDVLRTSPRPVIVVPSPLAPTGPTVIAYDGSLQAARTLADFVAAPPGPAGMVHLVTATTNARNVESRLERACRYLERHGFEATIHVLESARPPFDVIREHAALLGAGLLVMGAYGQPMMREFFLGSITRTALRDMQIPLFLSS